jgi:iron-sulfur cluster repair protein YtfE (RIC family)
MACSRTSHQTPQVGKGGAAPNPGPPSKGESPGVAGALDGEHAHLARLFQDACDAREQGRLMEAWAGLGEFRRELLRHMRMEEELVFPTFEIRAGLPAAGPTGTMRAEHQDIRCRLEQLVLALEEGHETRELQLSLGRMLAAHRRKEEAILYPVLDRLLSTAEVAALVSRLEALQS